MLSRLLQEILNAPQLSFLAKETEQQKEQFNQFKDLKKSNPKEFSRSIKELKTQRKLILNKKDIPAMVKYSNLNETFLKLIKLFHSEYKSITNGDTLGGDDLHTSLVQCLRVPYEKLDEESQKKLLARIESIYDLQSLETQYWWALLHTAVFYFDEEKNDKLDKDRKIDNALTPLAKNIIAKLSTPRDETERPPAFKGGKSEIAQDKTGQPIIENKSSSQIEKTEFHNATEQEFESLKKSIDEKKTEAEDKVSATKQASKKAAANIRKADQEEEKLYENIEKARKLLERIPNNLNQKILKTKFPVFDSKEDAEKEGAKPHAVRFDEAFKYLKKFLHDLDMMRYENNFNIARHDITSIKDLSQNLLNQTYALMLEKNILLLDQRIQKIEKELLKINLPQETNIEDYNNAFNKFAALKRVNEILKQLREDLIENHETFKDIDIQVKIREISSEARKISEGSNATLLKAYQNELLLNHILKKIAKKVTELESSKQKYEENPKAYNNTCDKIDFLTHIGDELNKVMSDCKRYPTNYVNMDIRTKIADVINNAKTTGVKFTDKVVGSGIITMEQIDEKRALNPLHNLLNLTIFRFNKTSTRKFIDKLETKYTPKTYKK